MLLWTASRTIATLRAARSVVASRPCAFVVAKTSMVHHPAATSTLRPFSLAASKNISNPEMMCRQCEQTKDHYACTTMGVCGKTAETSVSKIMIRCAKR
jgi:hydroxylamine reductase